MPTSSFVVELPLRVSPQEESRLQARLEAARQVYNACLGESLRRLALLRQSKLYQYARSLPRADKKSRALAFREANQVYGFSEYALHAYTTPFTDTWVNEQLDSLTIQKLATRAFQATQQYAFGKSAAKRAPGMFVDQLKRKAGSAGVWVNEFPTQTTKLSQTCHQCGAVRKKPLSQRWHVCECGVAAQRDLYSAFLAMCVDGQRLNADYAQSAWSGVDALLRAALSETQMAKVGRAPDSFGLGRRPSRSPV